VIRAMAKANPGVKTHEIVSSALRDCVARGAIKVETKVVTITPPKP